MKSNVYLLDSDVLIALADDKPTSHARAAGWFQAETRFATCPNTQGALVRHYMRVAAKPTIQQAKSLLGGFSNLPNHHFWPDDADYKDIPTKGVVGYKQVTDAYLVLLASEHGGLLAT